MENQIKCIKFSISCLDFYESPTHPDFSASGQLLIFRALSSLNNLSISYDNIVRSNGNFTRRYRSMIKI